MTDTSHERDYLWNPAAPPDPEIQRLERLLSPLRYAGPAPAPITRPRPHTSSPGFRPFLALAAAIAAVFLLAWIFGASERQVGSAWEVRALQGSVRIDETDIGASGELRVGQSLETAEDSRIRVSVADIGSLTIHPNSRLRLLRTSELEHRLALDHGSLDALITAPPRLFFVNTPSAIAVDLGCAYSLTVDEDGSGRIDVTFGWVALEDGRDASTIPAGAACLMHPSQGPGTPFFNDAPAALIDALRRFDFEGAGDEALSVILRNARGRDTLTLWHLLRRVADPARANVARRIAELSPLPPDVTEAALRDLDDRALDRTWSFLERRW